MAWLHLSLAPWLLPSTSQLISSLPFPSTSPIAVASFFFASIPAFCAASFYSSRIHAAKVLEQIADRESTVEVEAKSNLPLSRSVSRWKRVGCRAKNKVLKLSSKTKVTKWEKRSLGSEGFELRHGLEMCSKSGDVMEAISMYDEAVKRGLQLQQYDYNVLLYLCSSAAVWFANPPKSRRCNAGSFSSDELVSDYESSSRIAYKQRDKFRAFDRHGHSRNCLAELSLDQVDKSLNGAPIQLGDDMGAYARRRGFEIFDKMCLEKVPMSEATLTSVARMAMSMGDGDMAFDIVKQMKSMGITPRLRSYSSVILAFCLNGDVDKAFEAERHMLESGITPEEPELEVLLRASVLARRGDKVYYLLHKLRAIVRQVSPTTADLIEAWFKSSTASRVGKWKIDNKKVEEAVEIGGGGWHGLGWLGKGKWNVLRTNITDDGVCLYCGEKLVNIDLDPTETEKFANSVLSIAKKWEKNCDFENFQRWLDYYGPFEAVIDAANIGLSNRWQFSLIKVNAIANGIKQTLPSKKPPLIIVHNKRLFSCKMNEPRHMKILDKWENADAIYGTPTGSNDDWYWLYAAIKCKSLVVTNDEMRDHVFQLLGNDFFPRWKERHQVRFSFKDGSFQFHMPPACSIVIQESKRGHWHIPIAEREQGTKRTWMCVTRANLIKTFALLPDLQAPAASGRNGQANDGNSHVKLSVENVQKVTQSHSVSDRSTKSQIISLLEAAEEYSGCVIDFQI
ncbi:hypothetical protein HPP92_023596 [Vanilla planifolia]|uniref:ribonuclease P n=1 Tax=Vanilla planifolia TaxID=51239 RepID=A0A835PR54_VANPL|nr:hypothetical protein HPP92_023596 [Vanilla planifolia]